MMSFFSSCFESMTGLVAQAPAAAGDAGSVIGLEHYLVVGAIVFGLGLLIIITRRSTIAVLMGIELLLNSAGLNFVAFAKYSKGAENLDGQIVTLFIIVIAAAEAALALAIALNIFNSINSVELDDARSLKG
ncbi:MAG: NADH-quinone oxidoreductase subunit NuoK [Planctomycetota bacterium]|nr:NADH-quinone oxidoreductase subunit NuoK [Planctomycetota bacterium]